MHMRVRVTGRLRKLVRLDRRAVAELLEAQRALLWAQCLVWTRPAGKLAAPAEEAESQGGDAARNAEAERVALAIGRAAENGIFRPLCLVRAVALQRMLERRGIRGSRIRIGVKRERGRFAAHAWVEYGPLLLGDAGWHVGSFAPLTDLRMAPPS